MVEGFDGGGHEFRMAYSLLETSPLFFHPNWNLEKRS